jgi:hypothetical protein
LLNFEAAGYTFSSSSELPEIIQKEACAGDHTKDMSANFCLARLLLNVEPTSSDWVTGIFSKGLMNKSQHTIGQSPLVETAVPGCS